MEPAKLKIPLLEQDNWESWKLQVEMLLTQKELWRYVTLSSTHVLKDDEPAQDKKAWAIIGQLVGQQHYPHVLQFRTAKGLWDRLNSKFQLQATSRTIQLQHELTHLKQGPEESAMAYMSRVRDLLNRLEQTDPTIKESALHIPTISGISPRFATTVVVLEDNAAAFPITLDLIEQRLVAAEARQRRAEEEAAGGVFWDTKVGMEDGWGSSGRVDGRVSSKTNATSETRGEATGVVVVSSKGMLVSSNSSKGKSSQLLVEAMGMGVME
jgi:hypothetical protein